MLDAKNILFPTDFSDASLNALKAALPFRLRPESTLHILHLISWHGRRILSGSEYGLPMPTQRRIIKKLETDAKEKLASIAGDDDHVLVQILDESKNSVADSVLDYIKQNDIDLVVTGSDGKHELIRTLVGGTIEKILANSPVPVFATGPDTATPSEINSIVVAVDTTPEAEGVLRNAAEAATLFDASLTVFHVVQTGRASLTAAPGLEPAAILTAPDLEGSRSFIEDLCTRTLGIDVSPKIVIVTGIPDREIERYSESSGADMLVVGTHGHTGLKRLFLGSTAQHSAHHSACPVLVISSNCLAYAGHTARETEEN